jgi:dihydrofolate reductase
MRKLVLYIATSLDGYIAGPAGEIDWLFTDQDYGYAEFFAGVDAVVMGRKTYELTLSFGEYPYPGTRSFVFSRSEHAADANVTFISQDVGSFIANLKREAGKNIWLVGGGEIVRECLQHDLIDDFRIFIHPLVLGAGIPLFPNGVARRALRFVHSQHFNTGLVELGYERARERA